MRRTKREIMSGVDCISSHIVDHNTVEYRRENGDRVVRLHLTDVVTFKPDGSRILDSGGWKTPTTKSRMNDQITPWSIYQEQNEWYLFSGSYWPKEERGAIYHYHDGIILTGETCDGVVYDPAITKHRNDYRRKIRKYAKDYIAAMRAGNVPPPSAGDCWICCMMGEDGVSWGEHSKDNDHINSHIEEKYYVPSLLIRAINRHPVSQVAEWCIGSVWGGVAQDLGSMADIGFEQLQKSLYRYCYQYAVIE